MVRESVGIIFTGFWLFALPVILGKTVFYKMAQQMGTVRYYIMVFHLVIMILLPVKMVLRWWFTLKYFVYLPEFNLNL